MQVTCESCNARYKLDASRFSGRSARITCPRCQHVFVVEKDEEEVAEAAETVATETEEIQYNVDELDFRKVGIKAWKVKVKIGLVYDFSDYKTLAKYIADGRVTTADKISHDGKEWTEIGTIPDLAQHFIDVYRREDAAQNQKSTPAVSGVGEFDGDEPTDIFGLKQAEAAKAEVAAKKAKKSSGIPSMGSSRPKTPDPSAGMGVDDELMRMAQNLSEDLSTGDLNADTPPRFVDPFEQMKRKKRAAAGRESGAVSPGDSASSGEDGSGVSKPMIMALAGVIALAGGTLVYNNLIGGAEEGTDTVVTGSDVGASPSNDDFEATDDEFGSLVPVVPNDDAGADADDDRTDNAFSTGREDDEEEVIFQPACVRRGDCGQNDPSGQSSAAPSTTAAEPGSGRDLFTAAMTQRARGERSTALASLNGALAMEVGNSQYSLWLAELQIFTDSSHEECGANQSTGLRTLQNVDGYAADVAYLRGMHEYWCGNQDMAMVRRNLELARDGSIEAWSTRAETELNNL